MGRMQVSRAPTALLSSARHNAPRTAGCPRIGAPHWPSAAGVHTHTHTHAHTRPHTNTHMQTHTHANIGQRDNHSPANICSSLLGRHKKRCSLVVTPYLGPGWV